MCHFHKYKFHFILNSLPLYFSAKHYFLVAIKSIKNPLENMVNQIINSLVQVSSMTTVCKTCPLCYRATYTIIWNLLFAVIPRRQRNFAWIHFKMTWCQRIWIILFENKDKELQFLFFTGCGNGTSFVQISYTK